VTLTLVTIFHLLIQTRTNPTGKKTIRATTVTQACLNHGSAAAPRMSEEAWDLIQNLPRLERDVRMTGAAQASATCHRTPTTIRSPGVVTHCLPPICESTVSTL